MDFQLQNPLHESIVKRLRPTLIKLIVGQKVLMTIIVNFVCRKKLNIQLTRKCVIKFY
jgi:hypothetical protein